MKRKRLLGVTLALTVALTACTTLPTSSHPEEFEIEAPTSDPIEQYGFGPRPDVEPTRLIQDFLLASAAGVSDDFSAARQYLLPAAASGWHPLDEVVVYSPDSAPKVEVSAEKKRGDEVVAQALVTVEVVGTVDEDGVLHESPKSATSELKIDLAKNSSDQWRIASLDSALPISQSAFQSAFQQYDLFFVAQDRRALVADPRWVPRKNAYHSAIQLILKGPRAALRPAVVPDLGEGLSIPAGGLDVENRTARIGLEGEFTADLDQRLLLRAALDATLSQKGTLTNVVLEINGVGVDGSPPEVEPDYLLDSIVAVRGSDIVGGTLSDPEPLVPEDAVGSDPTVPAVGPLEDSAVAWLTSEGQEMRIQDDERAAPVRIPVDVRSALSVDRWNDVWFVGGSEQKLFVAELDGSTYEVSTGLKGGTEIEQAVVSPDGARIALLLPGSKGAEVWVGTVSRDRADLLQVSDLVWEERLGQQVVDVSWMESTTVVALTQGEGGADSEVRWAPVGSWMSAGSAPEGGERLSSGPKKSQVIVQKQDQVVFKRSGAGWIEEGARLKFLSYAG